MNLDLAPYIERLLYSNETVVLPGLGAFVSQSAPANIDYAGGAITPPAKVLTFNEHLKTDDGLLTYELVQEKGISDQDARTLIDASVAQIIEQLNQREIVALNGIGRLYKNYVQHIQFLPDAANFSRESFGLPPLQFSPLSRSREVTDAENTVAAAKPESTTTAAPVAVAATSVTSTASTTTYHNTTPPPPVFDNKPPSGGSQLTRLLLIFGLLVLSGALGYYFLKMQKDKMLAKKDLENTEVAAVERPEQQSVVPASQEPAETTKPKETTTTKPKEVIPDTKAPKATAQERTCIMVIGLFKDPDNIARLKTLIQNNGFEVYSVAGAGGAQSIGAKFRYSAESEVQANLAKLQKLTGVPNIKVKKQ